MKKNNQNLLKTAGFLLMILIIGSACVSCSKDDDNNPEEQNSEEQNSEEQLKEFGKKYFKIMDSQFRNESLPESNSQSLELQNVEGNSTVLPGGSNIIGVGASQNATEVIVGVEGQVGYFTVPLIAGRNGEGRGIFSDIETKLHLFIGQQAKGSFNIAFAVGDGQDNISSYEYLSVTLMEAGTGLLQVSLSWDQRTDMDLALVEPNGTMIYFGRRTSKNGGTLDIDSNVACNIDGINNENIFYADSPDVTIEYGEYEVKVDLWSKCNVNVNTNYTIIVHYGGEEIATTEGVNPHSGFLTPEEMSHGTRRKSVMKFNIQAPPAPRPEGNNPNLNLQSRYSFSAKKDSEVFKNFGSTKK